VPAALPAPELAEWLTHDLPLIAVRDLSRNKFDGAFAHLLRIAPLEHLDVYGNMLTGRIPDDIASAGLGALRSWLAAENKMSGTIPTGIGRLSELRVLRLQRNRLSGTLPTELGELSNLQELLVHGQSLWGTVPSALADLPQLSVCELTEPASDQVTNAFRGPLPPDIGDCRVLLVPRAPPAEPPPPLPPAPDEGSFTPSPPAPPSPFPPTLTIVSTANVTGNETFPEEDTYNVTSAGREGISDAAMVASLSIAILLLFGCCAVLWLGRLVAKRVPASPLQVAPRTIKVLARAIGGGGHERPVPAEASTTDDHSGPDTPSRSEAWWTFQPFAPEDNAAQDDQVRTVIARPRHRRPSGGPRNGRTSPPLSERSNRK